jgi:hypothetical protein
MQPITHATTNTDAHMPEGMEGETLPLTVCMGEYGPELVSFWQPSPDEIAAINQGKPVVLTIVGAVHPVVALGVEEQPC